MGLTINYKYCSGCGACESICPKHAIFFIEDELGFAYPRVDDNICINCNICNNVCPANGEYCSESLDVISRLAWGGYSKLNSSHRESSSGGIFYTAAAYFIRNGGVVYGAAFSDDFKSVRHIRVDSFDQLRLLQKSKYVQSSTMKIFKSVREDLESHHHVLFSGTPCQIEGLNRYLRLKNSDVKHLVTIDVICHGVPSPLLFKNYIMELEKMLDGPIVSYDFRTPTMNNDTRVIARGEMRKYEINQFRDPFFRLFHYDISLRESCYNCKYKGDMRSADITIGDFWGVEKVSVDLASNDGCSLVLIHTRKAKKLFEKLLKELHGHEVSYENALSCNKSYYYSAKSPTKSRNYLMKKLGLKSLDYINRKLTYGLKSYIRYILTNDKMSKNVMDIN